MCHSSLCDRVMLSGGCATSTPVVVRGLFHHPFRCRWALHCSAWELNDDDKHYFLSLIPLEERAACTRFARPEDCKRALASRVLQRLLGSLVFHVPLPSVKISRSASGKPFFAAVHSSSRIDFNVSHEGSWVVLVAEECCRCGVDVAGPELLNFSLHLPLVQRLQQLREYFSEDEMEQAHKLQGNDTAINRYYRILWCLKESYLKARGDGLDFPFGHVSFQGEGFLQHAWARGDDPAAFLSASATVCGAADVRSALVLSSLPDDHILSVALVPDDECKTCVERPAVANQPELSRPTFKDAAVPFHKMSGPQLLKYVHYAMSSSCNGRLSGA